MSQLEMAVVRAALSLMWQERMAARPWNSVPTYKVNNVVNMGSEFVVYQIKMCNMSTLAWLRIGGCVSSRGFR